MRQTSRPGSRPPTTPPLLAHAVWPMRRCRSRAAPPGLGASTQLRFSLRMHLARARRVVIRLCPNDAKEEVARAVSMPSLGAPGRRASQREIAQQSRAARGMRINRVQGIHELVVDGDLDAAMARRHARSVPPSAPPTRTCISRCRPAASRSARPQPPSRPRRRRQPLRSGSPTGTPVRFSSWRTKRLSARLRRSATLRSATSCASSRSGAAGITA